MSSTRKKSTNLAVQQQILEQARGGKEGQQQTTQKVDQASGKQDSQQNSSQYGNDRAPTVINGIKLSNEPDPSKVTTVEANDGKSGEPVEVSFTGYRPVGNGSFGVVFQAKLTSTGEVVAIKKVLQDRRFKNRELQIMRLTDHPNVCSLKSYFYSNGDKKDEVFLNLMLEYIPETIYRATRHFAKNNSLMPLPTVKLYMYQMFRSLAYIHALGICHRDIKPQNLLLDPATGVMKLCDFGSAKILVPYEPNVSYICSRYYRAPELIFGATDYTVAIDIWSTGCVMAELLLGRPIFPGESGVDQLVEIVKILGTPTKEQIKAMNRNYTEYKFPQIKTTPWSKVFSKNKQITPVTLDFLSQLLDYTPTARLTAIEALVHPFFDELRHPDTKMTNGESLKGLFNFSELELSIRPDLNQQLVPPHARADLLARGIDVDNFKPIPIPKPTV